MPSGGSFRAQGASEYLVVLAAVLLVGLAAISVLSSVYSAAGGAAEAESAAYWSAEATPFQILQAQLGTGLSCTGLALNSSGYKLLLRNAGASAIVLKTVALNGAGRTFCLAGGQANASAGFAPYQRRTINVLTGATCPNGSTVEAAVSFTYDRSPFTGRVQDGAKKLAAKCTGLALSPSAGEGGIEQSSQMLILTGSLPSATVGVAYSAALSASGGNSSSYSWSATGLPLGLSASAGGTISGTPANGTAGSYSVSVSVQSGSSAGYAVLPLLVSATGTSQLEVTTTALPDTAEGSAYSAGLSARGGTLPYSWSATGLPAGLSAGSSGSISGTPAAGSAGNYTVHAAVTDAASSIAQTDPDLSLRVSASGSPLQITTASPLPGGASGISYGPVQLTASGGSGAGYSWSNTSSLPSALSVNSQGSISGTPSSTGTYTIGIRVQDSGSNVAAKNFILAVGLVCGLPCCQEGEACAFTSDCCGSKVCIAGVCGNCKVQGQSCAGDYECCSEAQNCIGGFCSN